MAIKNNLKQIGAIVLFSITMSSCMEKKYDWSAGVSAPKEYPIEVYSGALGGYFFSEMGGFSNAGWGSGAGDSDINDVAPETLEMTWLSLTEGKFYTGSWTLPKEKIQQLFEEGFYGGPVIGKDAYNVFTIGLAPKGVVVVWMTGVGRQVEIARFQAHETTINPKEVYESAKFMFEKNHIEIMLSGDDVMPPAVKEKIKQNGYPLPTVYDAYREKYLWKPKVILPEGCKITSLYFKMCNGEKEDPFEKTLDQKNRAIPYCFEIVWKDQKGQEYVSRIAFTRDQKYWAKYLEANGDDDLPLDFDKNEIRTLFKDKIDKNIPALMVIKIDPTKQNDNEWVTDFYLEQAGKQYLIKEINQDSGKYQ
jgi:hypothetical protein